MESLFNNIYGHSPLMAGLLSRNPLQIIKVNEPFLRHIGLKQKEVIGKSLNDLAWLNQEMQKEFLKKINANGFLRNYPLSFKDALGNKRLLHIAADPFSQNGKNYIIMTMEVVQEKRSENPINRELFTYVQPMLNNALCWAWCKDTEGKYLAVNQTFADNMGTTPMNMLGKINSDFLDVEVARKFTQRDHMVMKKKKQLFTEHSFVQQGEKHWMATHVAPMLDEDGTVIGTTGFALNISKRVQAQEMQGKTERILLKAQEAAKAGTVHIDLQQKTLWVSPKVNRFFSVPQADVFDYEKSSERVLSADRENYQKLWESTYEGKAMEGEYRILRNGEVRYIYHKVTFDQVENGRPLSMIGVMLDITYRKKMEEAYRETRDTLLLSQELGKVGSIRYNLKNHTFWFSPETCRLLGITAAGEDMQVAKKMIVPELYAQLKKAFAEVQGGIPLERDIKWICNGKDAWIHLTGDVRENKQGLATHVYAMVLDITQRKESEAKTLKIQRQQELETLRTEFLSRVSHEMRTPMTIILSSMQLIQKYAESEESFQKYRHKIKKSNRYIEQNAFRMLKLVNNLIDITRIETGDFNIASQTCDIVQLISNIVQATRQSIEEKGIIVSFISSVARKNIHCDVEKIERAILNLLSNAAKFTQPDGEIHVGIEQKSDGILIMVQDTGEGISKEKQKHVFDMFGQLHENALQRTHEGTGIGLSLVKALIEMHGGRVTVQSEVGKGSTFFVWLPDKGLPVSFEEIKHNFVDIEDHKIQIELSDIYA